VDAELGTLAPHVSCPLLRLQGAGPRGERQRRALRPCARTRTHQFGRAHDQRTVLERDARTRATKADLVANLWGGWRGTELAQTRPGKRTGRPAITLSSCSSFGRHCVSFTRLPILDSSVYLMIGRCSMLDTSVGSSGMTTKLP
jgi:hypothetical protein